MLMSAGSRCSCSQGKAGQGEFKLLQCRNKNCVFARLVFIRWKDVWLWGYHRTAKGASLSNKPLKSKPQHNVRSRCPCVIQLPHRIHQTWKAFCEITPRQVWREQGGGTGMSKWIFFLFSNIFHNNLLGISFILMLISCKQKDGYTPMDTYTHTHTIRLYRVHSIMQTKQERSLADVALLHTSQRILFNYPPL